MEKFKDLASYEVVELREEEKLQYSGGGIFALLAAVCAIIAYVADKLADSSASSSVATNDPGTYCN